MMILPHAARTPHWPFHQRPEFDWSQLGILDGLSDVSHDGRLTGVTQGQRSFS